MRPIKLNPNLIRLVDRLSDGQYHDGTTLGDKLGMTRAAIWKAIKKLENYGVKIDSIKGKGYALQGQLKLIDRQAIKKMLTDKKINIEAFENMDSTNDYLKKYFTDDTVRVCLAERQDSGRARLKRDWYSPFGENIYFSCLYPFNIDVTQLTGLSLVVGLAMVRALKSFDLPDPILIKWPNDLMCLGGKLSGVLIELQAESYGACKAIIGIGLNVNMLSSQKQAIDQVWTSLRKISGEYYDRNILLGKLMNTLFVYLKRFECFGFSDFIDEWREVDYLSDKQITLQGVTSDVKGKVMGVNENGLLLLKSADGNVKAYSSGDTRIMKSSGGSP